MTFRARPVVKRSRRPSWESSGRRNLFLNIGFGLVVLAAIGILAAAAGASWYEDNFGRVAAVNGVTITKSDYRERYAIEQWRIDEASIRIRNELQAGRLTDSQAAQQQAFLEQRRGRLQAIAYERLIDAELQRQLAVTEGVTVSDADVDARLTEEATRKELRHGWVIAVAPETSPGATEPTDAQRAAAKAKAEAALADVKAGKAFEDVAKAVSTDSSGPQGGDMGWISPDANLDKSFLDALFAAAANTPTDIVAGEDGTYRFGRVTEIVPPSVDAAYQQSIADAKISLDAYRKVVRADLVRQRLEEKIVAGVVDTPSAQRHVSEIYVHEPTGAGDEVEVREILYSPNNDPNGAKDLAADDPAWKKAQEEAQAAYEALKPLAGKPGDLEAAFMDKARTASDDSGTAPDGGLLPYSTRGTLDRTFGDAVFKPGLKRDDLLAPVKSIFGWHVILFVDRRPGVADRMTGATLRAALPWASFAAIVADLSEGPNAAHGGDIGWVARGQLGKQLEDAIFAAEVGGLSPIVAIPQDGLYLFKVWEEQVRKPEGKQAADLRQSAFSTWYGAQKGNAVIERDLKFSSGASQ